MACLSLSGKEENRGIWQMMAIETSWFKNSISSSCSEVVLHVKWGCRMLISGDTGIWLQMPCPSKSSCLPESGMKNTRYFQGYWSGTCSRKFEVKCLLSLLRFKPIKGFEEIHSVLCTENKCEPFQWVAGSGADQYEEWLQEQSKLQERDLHVPCSRSSHRHQFPQHGPDCWLNSADLPSLVLSSSPQQHFSGVNSLQ